MPHSGHSPGLCILHVFNAIINKFSADKRVTRKPRFEIERYDSSEDDIDMNEEDMETDEIRQYE